MSFCKQACVTKLVVLFRNRPIGAAAALLAAFSAVSAQAATMNYSGGPQIFHVAADGVYRILADGAAGGSGTAVFLNGPGLGAEIAGDFTLTAGEVLRIYVGGHGSAGVFDGSGGGGTFVVGPGGVPLIVAGGGGGGGLYSVGQGGQAGAANSLGGASDLSGGGGGFSSSGGPSPDGNLLATGGLGFPSLAGGFATISGTPGANGGYGGGGGSGNGEGGGGGGYSGGDSGALDLGGHDLGGGGGGGSFDAGANQLRLAGVNAGNGFVEISELTSTVPEPASFMVIGVCLAGLWVTGRRRLSSINCKPFRSGGR